VDQEANQEDVKGTQDGAAGATAAERPSRRRFLKLGLGGLACLGAAGAGAYYLVRRGDGGVPGVIDAVHSMTDGLTATEVFKNDAPRGRLWELWQERGWVEEARHYLKLGRNVECKLCPNNCLLEPGDRSRCRNRVNKDGTLYTLTYGNACSINVDPIEKKPLLHFLPTTDVFSFASSGCGFRCLNCQNWDISQRKPEESKDPRGEPVRLTPERLTSLSLADLDRLSMFPEDVVALAEYVGSPSIAYTYSEPTVWYEYMFDTARLARERGLKNVWVTCGYIRPEPLEELAGVLDAANVDLKSFSDEIYATLNSGELQPILDTLVTLKRRGVWFEVTNLIVPTYTDKMDMIRRMCDWMLEQLGPDYPLHFSRFHPQHKLTHLPPTPIDVLVEAREVARACGLHHVYIGNVRGVADAETTFCPHCGEAVVRRQGFLVDAIALDDGKCAACGTRIAGVWSSGPDGG
jgi:pyruvate formate lyase activating enzyme